MSESAQPGWYNDPTGSYLYRYWDGGIWTNQISSGGSSGTDPNPMEATAATTPPAPGSAAPAPAKEAAQPTVQLTQKSGGSFLGTVLGVILLLVVVVVFIAILADGSDDGSSSTTAVPVTTEVPATTATTAAP